LPAAASVSVIAIGDATTWIAARRDRSITVTADVEEPWQDDGWLPAVLPRSLQ
jgi:hypothetical protein